MRSVNQVSQRLPIEKKKKMAWKSDAYVLKKNGRNIILYISELPEVRFEDLS